MGTFKDLTGHIFGRLTVVSFLDRKNKHLRWNCACKCGNTVIVFGSNLTRGHTISCGCAYNIPYKYCPASGLFFHGRKIIRKIDARGYITVRINTKLYQVHRLAWEMVNGPIPRDMEIDHINRIKYDNRIQNLRLVTHKQNLWNVTGRRNSTSKYKGVSKIKGTDRWYAYASDGMRTISLGTYDTEESAALAYNVHVISLNIPTAYLNKIPDELNNNS